METVKFSRVPVWSAPPATWPAVVSSNDGPVNSNPLTEVLSYAVDREQVALLDKEIERLQAEASQLQEEHDLVLQDRNVLKTDIDQLNAERVSSRTALTIFALVHVLIPHYPQSELNSKRKEVMAQVVAYEKAKAELSEYIAHLSQADRSDWVPCRVAS